MTRVRFDLWRTERERAAVIDHGLRVLTEDSPLPSLRIWHPKAEKPAVNYRFRSVEQREAYLLKYVESFDERVASRAAARTERAAVKTAHTNDVQVGHIFHYSWGYDQTNIQYFQVVARHGQNLTVHEIAQSLVPGSEGFMSEHVEPRIGHFLETQQPFTKRLQFTNDGRAYLSFPYGWCELWRGGSSYQSHYA